MSTQKNTNSQCCSYLGISSSEKIKNKILLLELANATQDLGLELTDNYYRIMQPTIEILKFFLKDNQGKKTY